METTLLPRTFVHKENGQTIRLDDPEKKFSPEAVLNYYANIYPLLNNATITGPEFVDDTVQYEFVSTIGKKG
jgi:PRTRC genetic system protein C